MSDIMRFLWVLLPVIQASHLSIIALNTSQSTLPSSGTETKSKLTLQTTEMRVYCQEAYPPLPYTLNIAACRFAISSVCRILVTMPGGPPRNRWIWTQQSSSQHCVAAFYIPLYASFAMLPSRYQCRTNIFGRILEVCRDSYENNIGSMNVKVLPDRIGPGSPFEEDSPRYLLATEQLDVP